MSDLSALLAPLNLNRSAPLPGLCLAVRAETYAVAGSTAAHLRAAVALLGPRRGGASFAAYTDWSLAWSYAPAAVAGGIAPGSPWIEVAVTCTLPRWRPPRSAATGLVDAWNACLAAGRSLPGGHLQRGPRGRCPRACRGARRARGAGARGRAARSALRAGVLARGALAEACQRRLRAAPLHPSPRRRSRRGIGLRAGGGRPPRHLNTGPAAAPGISSRLPFHFQKLLSWGLEDPSRALGPPRCTYCFDNSLAGGAGTYGALIDHVLLRGLDGVARRDLLRRPLDLDVSGRRVRTGFSDHYGVVVEIAPRRG